MNKQNRSPRTLLISILGLFCISLVTATQQINAETECEQQYPRDQYTEEDRETYILDCIEYSIAAQEEVFEDIEEPEPQEQGETLNPEGYTDE